ncbi:replication-associated protein [Trichonephila clavipes]|nr:replication-associated protein [Trichonephila clavipes]
MFKIFRSSVRDAEIILGAGQRIMSEINILVEKSQGSSQIPKSKTQLLNAERKKKIALHENIKIIQTYTVNLDMQDYLEKKLENRLTSFQAILEKQTTLIMEAFQKTMESVFSHLSKIFEMGKSSHSPLRKKKAVDREDRSGGVLIIAVPSNISAQQIPIQIQQTRELEILAIKIHVRNISFYIVNIYAPRGFNIIIIKSFLESLMAPMITFGDFNLHHPMWRSDHISRYSNEFVEWITDSNLVLLNTTVPTYRSSTGAASLIDLTVCSSSMSGYCNSYVLDCSFESDHSPIITELSLLN